MTDAKKSPDDYELELAKMLIDSGDTADGSELDSLDNLSEQQRREYQQAQECLRLLQAISHSAESHEVPNVTAFDASALKRIGRFRIIRELGSGGFGVVLLARDETLERDVALKIPRPETLLSEDSRRRFDREARAAGILSHPSIVPIYECGQLGPVCYIAFGYCQGQTLEEWVQLNSLADDPKLAAQMVAELADAVSHAHRRGVIHRDLKPANILIASEDSATDLASSLRITDFGLAKFSQDNDGLTLDGALIGTPTYMAPEQAIGNNASGAAVDVYALGVILFQLLTGEVPFKGKSNLAILKAVTDQPAPSPRKINSNVSRELAAICLKCLEKDPEQRYESAHQLNDDLNRFLDNRPVLARRRSWQQEAWLWSKRNPLAATLSSLLLASLIAGTATALVLYRNSQANLVMAESNFATAKETVDAMFQKALSVELQAQPEVRRDMMTTVANYYTQFIQQQQQDAELNYELAEANRKLAKIAYEMGEYSKSIKHCETAGTILQECVDQNSPIEHRLEKLNNLTDIALAFDALSDLPESLHRYQLAMSYGEKLYKNNPKNELVTLDFSRTIKNTGYVLHELKEYDEAKDHYDRALHLRQGLLDSEPENSDYRFRVAFSHSTLADWYSDNKQSELALNSAQIYLSLIQGLADEFPRELKYRNHLPAAFNRVADVYRRFPGKFKNGLERASRHLQVANNLQSKLLEEYPSFFAIRKGLWDTTSNLGTIHSRLGNSELAIEQFRLGIKALNRGQDEAISILAHKRWSYVLYSKLADELLSIGQSDEAALNYSRAEREIQPILDNSAAGSSQVYETWLYRKGVLQFRLQKYDSAIEEFEEYFSQGGKSWEIAAFVAMSHLANGDFDSALDASDRAIKMARGRRCYARLVRAIALAQLGQMKLARQEWEKGRDYLEKVDIRRHIALRHDIQNLLERAQTAVQAGASVDQ